MKEKVLVVCPGRGTYNAAELGYFARHHSDKPEFLAMLDAVRERRGQTPISTLDAAEKHSMRVHGTGENASLLIYGCSIADFLSIDRERFDIVGVTGNSMGWYLALACSGALSLENGAHLVNEMGRLTQEKGVGGQIVYPSVDNEWRPDPARAGLIQNLLADTTDERFIATSIHLGGLHVFAADEPGLNHLTEKLPAEDRYPMRLINHAAFHSSLLDPCVPAARQNLSQDLFGNGSLPMIDGQGRIWSPGAYDIADLYQYTLGTQINSTYDFTKAISVGIKEYAPDRIIVLGPGTTMGAPVAQTLIRETWRGIDSKTAFKTAQDQDPYIISMGMDHQRGLAVATS